MPTRIVLQPNGKLAAFSSVVDNFTTVDMTPQEAEQFCMDELDLGRKSAREKVRAGMEDHVPYTNTPGSGSDRWKEALQTITIVHGIDELQKVLSLCGLSDYDIAEYRKLREEIDADIEAD